MRRRKVSFASTALHLGTITIEQLRSAYTVSRLRGRSLDAVLMGNAGALTPADVRRVREAQRELARVSSHSTQVTA